MPSGDTFDFIDQPVLPNTVNRPNQLNPEKTYQKAQQSKQATNPIYKTPVNNDNDIQLSIGGFHFTTVEDENSTDNKMVINIDSDGTPIANNTKARRTRKKTEDNGPTTDIIRAEGEVVDTPTINTYFETASMIKNAMDQIDAVANDIKLELDAVRQSRTLKSKYTTVVGLAGNLSDLLNAKVNAIKELNNCISKSNDMDYRKEKDRREAVGNQNSDDRAIMDLYRNIMSSQQMLNSNPASMETTGIIRGSGNNDTDQGYLNYMANMSPDLMNIMYDQNPDIKECVIFDASTGAKWFQIMNVKTGQPVPGAQAHSALFMEDTVLDIKNKIAKNSNINETYPIIILNENITHEY